MTDFTLVLPKAIIQDAAAPGDLCSKSQARVWDLENQIAPHVATSSVLSLSLSPISFSSRILV